MTPSSCAGWDFSWDTRQSDSPRGLSAYVTQALERYERWVALGDWLELVEKENGPFPEEMVREAERLLDEPVVADRSMGERLSDEPVAPEHLG